MSVSNQASLPVPPKVQGNLSLLHYRKLLPPTLITGVEQHDGLLAGPVSVNKEALLHPPHLLTRNDSVGLGDD